MDMLPQIQQLLALSTNYLVYSKSIAEYPENQNKNFDLNSPIDYFYKNICSCSFDEALLVITSLMESRDHRVISFYNHPQFEEKKFPEIEDIKKKLEETLSNETSLKKIRNQIIAHQDHSQTANNFPFMRMQGMIRKIWIKKLDEILKETISLFFKFSGSINQSYNPCIFERVEEEAKHRVDLMLKNNPPILTEETIV
jgi:hypothetical protein